jgi:hypothetical protein
MIHLSEECMSCFIFASFVVCFPMLPQVYGSPKD